MRHARVAPGTFAPLQFVGPSGGIELLILFIVGLLLVAIPAYYVYSDATGRGNENATLWTVATVLGGLVGNVFGALLVVVLYLIVGR